MQAVLHQATRVAQAEPPHRVLALQNFLAVRAARVETLLTVVVAAVVAREIHRAAAQAVLPLWLATVARVVLPEASTLELADHNRQAAARLYCQDFRAEHRAAAALERQLLAGGRTGASYSHIPSHYYGREAR